MTVNGPTTTTPEQAPATTPAEQAPPITVTEKAAAAVKNIIERERQSGTLPEKVYLRVHVQGGGCSGFQHKLNLDQEVTARDDVYEVHGILVVIDRKSRLYLDGAVVDFHDDLNRHGFSIHNPQAKSTCGCGSSFSM
jgi:iron-sulfur cluster assembly protein